MTEHRYQTAEYRPHAVRMPARTAQFVRPMAVRAGTPLAGAHVRAWQPSNAVGFRAVLWRLVLGVVDTIWAE